jgi:hypothetical protein
MPARAFGDSHVQGHILTAGQVAGYLEDAISRWPGIAQNGIFNVRMAIQGLISNGQDRIDANAKYFSGQMYGRYTPLGQPTNFTSKAAKKKFEQKKAKTKRH